MLGRAALPLLRPRAPPRVALRLPVAPIQQPTTLPSVWLAARQNRAYARRPQRQQNADGPKPGTEQPSNNNKSTKHQPEAESKSESVPESTSPGSSNEPQPEFQQQQEGLEQQKQQQQPLPDLTQGIPSTLLAELEGRARPSRRGGLNLTDDPERAEYETYEGAGSGGGGGGRDIPKDGYVSSVDRRRNRMANIAYVCFFVAGAAFAAHLGRNWDSAEEEEKHPEAPSGWGPTLFWNRISARLSDITSYYKDPAFEKLLPEEDPAFRQPYTLVLSLEDLLIHSEWTREHGWRVAKRPGVDYFLKYLNQYYELVLFTSVPVMMADQVIRKLDPFRIIRWPLFREATKYEDGEYVKDLSYLNRDLSKVILIDTHAPHAKRQPENSIILPKWEGDAKDKSLVALIPFLEYVAGMGIEDVRPVIASFRGSYIPTEFARRERLMRERFEAQLTEEKKKKPKHSISSIASLLGVKPLVGAVDGIDHEGIDQGKMLWDQIRERGQRQYAMIERDIREHGDKWLAEMEAEEKKLQAEQMNEMKKSFFGFFGAGKDNK